MEEEGRSQGAGAAVRKSAWSTVPDTMSGSHSAKVMIGALLHATLKFDELYRADTFSQVITNPRKSDCRIFPMRDLMTVGHDRVDCFFPAILVQENSEFNPPLLIERLRRFYKSTCFRILNAIQSRFYEVADC